MIPEYNISKKIKTGHFNINMIKFYKKIKTQINTVVPSLLHHLSKESTPNLVKRFQVYPIFLHQYTTFCFHPLYNYYTSLRGDRYLYVYFKSLALLRFRNMNVSLVLIDCYHQSHLFYNNNNSKRKKLRKISKP